MSRSRVIAGMALALAVAGMGTAVADEYRFMPAPQIDLNRVYRVNRLTGEMGACQYAIKDNTVGVALCYPAGEGGGPQPIPGDYDLVRSNHEREGGVFRVNVRTGEVSICYVLTERVVCTPQAR
ncbi:hypothetical protein [Flaviflagellibacter deserti]|uniref:Uncharacterized protein n=1 Tax=Flaviflagellibacter deserti TaxID=2267266 RepID=A0ABV9Z069_9HYPH